MCIRDSNKELVRVMEDKVFSEKNVDAATKVAREFFTSDFTVHDWLGDHKGLDALAEGLAYTQADFLDWKAVSYTHLYHAAVG